MDSTLAARLWAREEYDELEAGDARHRARLVAMASSLLRRPGGTITDVFRDAAERKGAYTFLASDVVPTEALLEASGRACALRAAGQPFVFVPVDGSSLSLRDPEGKKGFGRLGAKSKGRGLKVISAIALDADGTPLGLAAQTYWARTKTKRATNHAKVPVAQKETQKWLDTIDAVHAHFAQHAPQTQVVFVIDREADSWAILERIAQHGRLFVIRSARDRVAVDTHGRGDKLRAIVGRSDVRMTYVLDVPAGPQRTARRATMEVRVATVLLPLRENWSKKKHAQAMHVVSTREVGTTPAGEKPLDWLLLTKLPVETDEQRCVVIAAYEGRWPIESFHKTWKSGGCRIEESQLRQRERMTKWAAMSAAVAIRIERLKHVSRTKPDTPASDELSLYELNALLFLKNREKKRTETVERRVPTIAQATRWIAHLGGYVEQKSAPGSITIGRGMERVLEVAATFEALELTPMLPRKALEKAAKRGGTG